MLNSMHSCMLMIQGRHVQMLGACPCQHCYHQFSAPLHVCGTHRPAPSVLSRLISSGREQQPPTFASPPSHSQPLHTHTAQPPLSHSNQKHNHLQQQQKQQQHSQMAPIARPSSHSSPAQAPANARVHYSSGATGSNEGDGGTNGVAYQPPDFI